MIMNWTMRILSVTALSVTSCCIATTSALAQAPTGFGASQIQTIQNQNSTSQFSVSGITASLRNRAVPLVGVQGVNQRNFLANSPGVLSPKAKPFSSVTRGPTVNPYLALSAPRASASDYYSIIRPQQQQQKINERQQAIAIQQQRRLNQLAARAPYSATGDANSAPTGHAAVFQSLGSFQNTGGYFPTTGR